MEPWGRRVRVRVRVKPESPVISKKLYLNIGSLGALGNLVRGMGLTAPYPAMNKTNKQTNLLSSPSFTPGIGRSVNSP